MKIIAQGILSNNQFDEQISLPYEPSKDCVCSFYRLFKNFKKFYNTIIIDIDVVITFIDYQEELINNQSEYPLMDQNFIDELVKLQHSIENATEIYTQDLSFAIHQSFFLLDQLISFILEMSKNAEFLKKRSSIEIFYFIKHNLRIFKNLTAIILDEIAKMYVSSLKSINPKKLEDIFNISDYLYKNISIFEYKPYTQSVFTFTFNFYDKKFKNDFLNSSENLEKKEKMKKTISNYIFKIDNYFGCSLSVYLIAELSLCFFIEELFFKLGKEEICDPNWIGYFQTNVKTRINPSTLINE